MLVEARMKVFKIFHRRRMDKFPENGTLCKTSEKKGISWQPQLEASNHQASENDTTFIYCTTPRNC